MKTPQETFDEAYANFKALLKEQLSKLTPACICAYPRIIEFLFKRSNDAYLLKYLIINDCFTHTHTDYGVFYEEEIYSYTYKNCGSEFKHTYSEKGINDWEVVRLLVDTIGSEVSPAAPNYLDALYAELHGKENFLAQNRLFKATAHEVSEYLFEKKV